MFEEYDEKRRKAIRDIRITNYAAIALALISVAMCLGEMFLGV